MTTTTKSSPTTSTCSEEMPVAAVTPIPLAIVIPGPQQPEMDPRIRNFLQSHFEVEWADPKKAAIVDLANKNEMQRDLARARFNSLASSRRTPAACAKADEFWLDAEFHYRVLQSNIALKQVEAWHKSAPVKALHDKMQSKEIFKAADFQILAKLGEGGYGSVYRALHIPTNHIVALKEVDNASSDIELKEQRLLPLNCGVVPCYGTFRAITSNPAEPNYNILKTWLVMKYCSKGTLVNKVESGRLKHKEAAHILKKVTKTLIHLHKHHGIVHNDIKLANILVDEDGSILVGDLGVARRGTELSDRTGGTLSHMAPEKIADRKYLNGTYHNDSKIDVFALGVMFCEMVFWQDPFPQFKQAVAVPTIRTRDQLETKLKQLQDTLQTVYNKQMAIPKKLYEQEPLLKDFLHSLLAFDPQERSSLSAIRKHPWMKSHGKWTDRMMLQVRSKLNIPTSKKNRTDKTKHITPVPTATETSPGQPIPSTSTAAHQEIIYGEC